MDDAEDRSLISASVTAVTTIEQLLDVGRRYLSEPEVVFDVETIGSDRGIPTLNSVAWISLATAGKAHVIPMGHPNGTFLRWDRPLLKSGRDRLAKGQELREQDYSRDLKKATPIFSEPPDQLTPGQVFEALRPLFFEPERTVIGHNIKFDANSIRKYYAGELMTAQMADTLIVSFLLSPGERQSLAEVTKRHLGYDMVKGVGADISAHGFNEVAEYSWRDARHTWLLWRRLNRLLDDSHRRVFRLETDVLRVVCEMEYTGVNIDTTVLKDLQDHLDDQISIVKATAYREAGRPFNVNSNAEKIELLFTERGLTPKEFTPGGDPSVSEEALAHHRGDALVDALRSLAYLIKMRGTYVTPYLGGYVERTVSGKSKTEYRESMLIKGRIHGQFLQYGTETGRFSSKQPNLQNIPARSDLGKKIRNAFIPDDDHVIVQGDFSQIEPRILASLSGDEVMIANYRDGGDLYQEVADILEITRRQGKELILSTAYGVGPDTMSQRIGITKKLAEQMLADFDRRFPKIPRFKRAVIAKARSRRPPYVETILGRRRYLPDLLKPNLRSRGERQAVNTTIQGSAADVMKVALVRVHRCLPPGARLLLTVHDEVVCSVPRDLAEETAELVREAMEGSQFKQLIVPLVADIKIATNWGACK